MHTTRTTTVRITAVAMTIMMEFAKGWIFVIGWVKRSLGFVDHAIEVLGKIKDLSTWRSVSKMALE